ncbi:hypothetical protein BBJ28_00014615 [Nothophytophthora sp. Chile5]|nr:hypothetical protein BBJ28_00014615 [Nothophytophthora sp. Chile5]
MAITVRCEHEEAFVDQMCQDLASESDDLIGQAKNALVRMQSYDGCLQLIQKVCTSPFSICAPNDADLKAELVAKLAPNVDLTRALYELSIDIESIFSALIQLSAQKSTKKAAGFLMESISSFVEFAVCFDNIKSRKPDIQNDLSHFRRVVAVSTLAANQLESLSDAPLNAMSFFVADHCPMLKMLIRAVENAMAKEPSAVDVAALLANSRCSSIKRCVKELVQWKQTSHGATAELLDTIRYCSLHYNDSTTPEKLRALMDK